MPYFSIRLTPCAFLDPSKNAQQHLNLCMPMFREFISSYSLDTYIICYEYLDKYLEKTNPHFHFNFLCEKEKETVRVHFLRICESILNVKPKGNKQYALSVHTEPDCIHRWFRYCVKERSAYKISKGFTDLELQDMAKLAQDERKRASTYNIQKRDNKKERSTIFQRYSVIIEKDLGSSNISINYQTIWLKFLDLFIKNDNAINPHTLGGYSHLFLLKKGIITPHEFYIQSHKYDSFF